MTPGFSIPTDNIYKFYALLGLALIVSSILAFVYVYESSRARVIVWTEEILLIDQKDEFSKLETDRKELLTKLIKVEEENKSFFLNVLNTFFAIGIVIGSIGLYQWHFIVQRNADNFLKLQIEVLELEVKERKGEREKVPFRYY